MKTLRVATMLVTILLMTGCTTAQAIRETPSPTFSSAGKEALSATKKTAEALQKEATKAAEKFSEKEANQDKQATDKKPQGESNPGSGSATPSGQQETPKTTPVPQQNTVPEPTPTPTPEPDPVPQPAYEEPAYQEPEPTPTPAPAPPPQACPGGKNPDLACDVVLDSNYYRETFSSYSEAMSKGQYYMDEVMYIGDIEITSYSVQEVYRNDHSIAYYGLNLWSNGSLIQ